MASSEGIYSHSDLVLLSDLPIQQMFESPCWSETRFQKTSLDMNNIERSSLFLNVFAKIVACEVESCEIQVTEILTRITDRVFFSRICTLLSTIKEVNEDWCTLLENILKMLRELCSKFPKVAFDSVELCIYMASTITKLMFSNNDDVLNDRLSKMMNDVETIRRSITDKAVQVEIEGREKKRDTCMRKPSIDFRKIPILPTRDDIFYEPFQVKEMWKASYENLDQYLDVHFRQIRAHSFTQLRSGIYEYIRTKSLNANSVRLYRNVRIVSKETCADGTLYEIQLEERLLGHIKFERNRPLAYGSILCMSPDDFDTLYFAVVENANHDQINTDCTLKIKIRQEQGESEIPMELPLTMIESTVNFELHRHVLASLQNIYEEDLPFRRYLVEGLKNILPPLYLQDNTDVEYDMTPMISNSKIFKKRSRKTTKDCHRYKVHSEHWPSAEELHLDESQYKAFQCALTREFVMIRGPPGTGKTHVGLIIAKTLLHNRIHWMNERKINENIPSSKNCVQKTRYIGETSSAMLIVSKTNNGLDQFIEGILKFLDPENIDHWKSKFVRVGSKCTNSINEALSLKHKRKHMSGLEMKETGCYDLLSKSKETMGKIKWMLKKSLENVFGEKILMNWVEEVKTLRENSIEFDMLEWLGIDEKSLRQSVSKDYEQSEVESTEKDMESETVGCENEEYVTDTEAESINCDIYIDDEDYKTCDKFEEIGASLELIVVSILENNEFDEKFSSLLKERANKAKTNIRRGDIMTQTEVEKSIEKPWKIPLDQRWRMYRYFLHQLRQKAINLLHGEEIEYAKLQAKCAREKQMVIDYEILSHSAIIAMTTAGAVRYQDVLNEIGPKIIIVVEAAEILEAHIIPILNSFCEHLILIGDHSRLEMKSSGIELHRKHYIDSSLFERMINLGVPYVSLNRQHRMRPDISQLLRPVYGRELIDHDNVLDYEHVLGIEKNVYFVSHSAEEYKMGDTQTFLNDHEAMYIECLTRYLLKQGYTAKQITIITPYSGQMNLIQNRLSSDDFKGIRISILDKYQGEENDIVILSLVRCNTEGNIGFLDKEKRVCMALSRSRIGLYVIGNFDLLRKFSHKCKLWQQVIKMMENNEALGKGLPLFCRNHKLTRMLAVHSEDFDKVPEGGCLQKCSFILKCGHVCNLHCHPRDPNHTEITCQEQCSSYCEKGHKCSKRCHFPHDCQCGREVKKCLPCDHKLIMACHINPEYVTCKFQVNRKLKCGHTGVMLCFENPLQYKCDVTVQRFLECGHQMVVSCHDDKEHFKCKKIVLRTLPCEHKILLECHVDVNKYDCKQMIVKKLQCKHEAEVPCHLNVLSFKCMEDVTEKRSDKYKPKLSFTYYLTGKRSDIEYKCEHFYTRKCHELPSQFQLINPCKEQIKKNLECGHIIAIACHQQCEPNRCKTQVMTTFRCHHKNIFVPCYQRNIAKCRSVCGKLCEAGYTCQQVCHYPDLCSYMVRVKSDAK